MTQDARGAGWEDFPHYRRKPLAIGGQGKVGFTPMPVQTTGVKFNNHLSDTAAARNQIRLSGSGVAAGDVNGDGNCDLYFCRQEGSNALYLNQGDWRFVDATDRAGVACPNQFSTGALLADADGDGDLDLFVNAIGRGTRFFVNDGTGRFRERLDGGLERKFGSMSMAMGDLDGDGDLDLYVANYRTTTIRSTGLEFIVVNGRRRLKPEDRESIYITPDGFIREQGEIDAVYLNQGRGRFTRVGWTGGRFLDAEGSPLKKPPRDWGFSVMVRDMNGDGLPDIYTCNDFWSPDRIWLNQGKGRFKALRRVALPNTSSFSMGIDFADIDCDGLDDFLVLDMLSPDHLRRITQASLMGLGPPVVGFANPRPQVERNTVFLNRGNGSYAEIAQYAGLQATGWSWCPIFLDVDLDGYEDLLVTTGYGFDTQDADADAEIRARGPWPREKVPFKLLLYPRLPLPNKAFRNRGDLTFKDVSDDWGFNFTGYSQGMCLADLDNDGDRDVVVNNMNHAAGLYRNDATAPRIAVRLRGHPPNRYGVGARLWLRSGSHVQSREMIAGGRFLSSDQMRRVFAGIGRPPYTIEVDWRGGKRTVIENVEPNALYEVFEADEKTPSPSTTPASGENAPLFEDVSSWIAHRHHEEYFDDFARQPLLPRRLSQLGPGVSWYDVDGDGFDDLIVGSGRGGRLAVFRNQHGRSFVPLKGLPISRLVTRDQTAILGFRDRAGNTELLAGSSNYEDGLAFGGVARTYNLAKQTLKDVLPAASSSTGPLAMADIDSDGDLDLFVGGRVIPARYPEAADSILFVNHHGHYRASQSNAEILNQIGLVSGAVFSDLDADGDPDLVLACEWGPPQILRNEGGQFENATASYGLDRYPGWWNGVAAGDFDRDGRMDLALSNQGRNSRLELSRGRKRLLFYGDFNGDGILDVVESVLGQDGQPLKPELTYEAVVKGLPEIRNRFPTRRAFGEASLREIIGHPLAGAKHVQASVLESMVFLNRGDHFETRVLPPEAQFAPAYGICVADFDGDGNEDLFLSQNDFATRPEYWPNDGGCGLLLRGHGNGSFDAVPTRHSGIAAYGEQRGCAVADFDHDGRVDLVVGQNAYDTKLFRNRLARSGLTVRLNGPPGNPRAIGAQLRLKFGSITGPIRELHAGSGYWSQDSGVAVLAAPAQPTAIWIRWPGGKVTESRLTARSRAISVNPNGQIIAQGN